MGIQQRLSKQRYGPMNIKSPTKDDLDEAGIKTTRLRKPDPDLFDSIIYMLRFPPSRDRYYPYYIYTIEKYMHYYDLATKQSQWQSRAQLMDIHLAGKLLFMQSQPSRFHGYHNFKWSWLYNLLCAMRTYVITQRYLRGEIQTNNTTASWSAGFEPWPKPMGITAGELLADKLYDVITPRMEFIESKSIT